MKCRFVFALLISVFLAFGAVCLCRAADCWIDPNGGQDSNNGSEGSPWRTITHALDWIASNNPGSAGNAHTIHAVAGTYAASTNGETFPLNMQSYVSLLGEGRNTTILDAETAAYHVIYCSAVDNVTVEGFTITRGNANGSDADSYGGGISCYYSSPTIRNNTITGNNALVRGGGIHCEQSSPTISDNTITNNAAGRGGGISCGWYSSPTIKNNTITGNTANDGTGGGMSSRGHSSRKTGIDAATGATPRYGGGIECFYYSSPAISNNTISDNTANQDGGGMCCGYRSSPTVSNNTISDNRAVGSLGVGGGIECWYQSPLTISNNRITGNTAYRAGGIYTSSSAVNISDNTITANSQAGISCAYPASPTISNNIIAGNSASGIECWYNSSPTISNNTITGNPTNGIFSYNSMPTIFNCIIWANGDDLSDCSATFCCIEDNDEGEGNIHDDPLFVSGPQGDYYLSHAGVNARAEQAPPLPGIGVNASGLRIVDCGLRNLSHADANSSSVYNQTGHHPQINHELPTANCQRATANCQRATGNRQLPTGNGQQATDRGKQCKGDRDDKSNTASFAAGGNLGVSHPDERDGD